MMTSEEGRAIGRRFRSDVELLFQLCDRVRSDLALLRELVDDIDDMINRISEECGIIPDITARKMPLKNLRRQIGVDETG